MKPSQELQDCQSQMTDLTNRWYQNVRVSPEHTEDEEELVYERGWQESSERLTEHDSTTDSKRISCICDILHIS